MARPPTWRSSASPAAQGGSASPPITVGDGDVTAPIAAPSPPASPPTVRPPATEPAKYQATVRPHRVLRARSPSGLMLASIDSPQGDQEERSAATTATASPARVTSRGVTVGRVQPRGSAG